MRPSTRLRKCTARLLIAALPLIVPHASNAQNLSPPHANPALWRIQHGASTVFLFGSLHILPHGYPWTTPAIEAAMGTTDQFIFEVPVDDDALMDEQAFIVRNGILRGRQSLRGLLSPIEYDTYSAVLRRAGLNPEQFERYRPWLASLMLGLAYLHGPDLRSLKGADDDITRYAVGHGKQILYLETPWQQMELLDSGDDKLQLSALRRLILTLPRSRTEQKELLESWSAGDTKRFASLLEGYFRGSPEAKDVLIDRRNRNWLGAVKRVLERPGITMITVGAAHMGGKNGLLALVCGEGYNVERMANMGGNGAKICAGQTEEGKQ